MAEKLHLGIDFGTKLGGTTAICYPQSDTLQVVQSDKNEDADLFITQIVAQILPQVIYFDAPLSIPGAYFGKGDDYFFREGDRKVNAMSPMFIGGLTARAMKLHHQLIHTHPELIIYETYPGYLARYILELKELYVKKTKEIEPFLQKFEEYLPLELACRPTNWHQMDAILAWYSGWRHQYGFSLSVGNKEEGQIII